MKQLKRLKLKEFVEMKDNELKFIVGGTDPSGASGSSGACDVCNPVCGFGEHCEKEYETNGCHCV